jgi:hypothetical protein
MCTALDYRNVVALVSGILPQPISENILECFSSPDLDFSIDTYDSEGYLKPLTFSGTCSCGRTKSFVKVMRDSPTSYRVYIDKEGCSYNECSQYQTRENSLCFVDLRVKGYITTQEELTMSVNSVNLRFSSYITEIALESKFKYLYLGYC